MCANSAPNLNPCLLRKYERLSWKLKTGLLNPVGRPRQLPRTCPGKPVISTLGNPPVLVMPVLGIVLAIGEEVGVVGSQAKVQVIEAKPEVVQHAGAGGPNPVRGDRIRAYRISVLPV